MKINHLIHVKIWVRVYSVYIGARGVGQHHHQWFPWVGSIGRRHGGCGTFGIASGSWRQRSWGPPTLASEPGRSHATLGGRDAWMEREGAVRGGISYWVCWGWKLKGGICIYVQVICMVELYICIYIYMYGIAFGSYWISYKQSPGYDREPT